MHDFWLWLCCFFSRIIWLLLFLIVRMFFVLSRFVNFKKFRSVGGSNLLYQERSFCFQKTQTTHLRTDWLFGWCLAGGRVRRSPPPWEAGFYPTVYHMPTHIASDSQMFSHRTPRSHRASFHALMLSPVHCFLSPLLCHRMLCRARSGSFVPSLPRPTSQSGQ